jgi:hypothetical protein
MVKRCRVCREFTEQRCARCEERCCDDHIYCSRIGGKELCLACKKQLDPEKQPPDMFQKGGVVGTAVMGGMAVSSLIAWKQGVFVCFYILCFLGIDVSAEPESKSTRRRRLACAGAGAETSPILKFIVGVSLGMALTWIIHNLFVCTSKRDLDPGTHPFDSCFVPRVLGPLFGTK